MRDRILLPKQKTDSVEIELTSLATRTPVILPPVTGDEKPSLAPPTAELKASPPPDTNTVKSDESRPALYYLKDFKKEQLVELENYYNKLSPEKKLRIIKDIYPDQKPYPTNVQITRYELEKLIAKHKAKYALTYLETIFAAGTNIPWIYYSILTGKAGIQGFADIIGTTVSDDLAATLGATLSTVGATTYLFYSSPAKCAAVATLAYATEDGWYDTCVKLTNAMRSCQENPSRAKQDFGKFISEHALAELVKAAKSTANFSILGVTYFTVGMSEITPFIDEMNTWPPSAKWLLMLAIQYFSWRYNDEFLTKSYYDGIKFWQNKEGREYLIQKLFKGLKSWKKEEGFKEFIKKLLQGEFAIPLQVFFQGIISTVGLRSFPNYYYMAEGASKALGGYISAPVVAGLVAVHSLCALYPSTYKNYMQSDEDTDKLLKGKINWDEVNQRFAHQIQQLNLANLSEAELNTLKQTIADIIIQTQLPQLGYKAREKLTAEEIAQRIQAHFKDINFGQLSDNEKLKFQKLIADSIIQAEKDILEDKIRKDLGYLGLFKEEPWTIATVGWQGALGAYFGVKFLAPLLAANPSTAVTTMSALAGAALFAGFTHRAETNRTIKNLTLKQLQTLSKEVEEKAKKEAEEKNTNAAIAGKIIGAGFVAGTAGSSIISTVGSNTLISANPSPLLNVFIAYTATQSGLNTADYMIKNISSTLTGIFESLENACQKDEKAQPPERPQTKESTASSPGTTPAALFGMHTDVNTNGKKASDTMLAAQPKLA